MNKNIGGTLRLVAVLCVALAVAVWAFGYHCSEFKGGLAIRDSGFFSYPRYHVRVGELPLWKDGEYQFMLSGLPPELLSLALEVADASDVDRPQLASLATTIHVAIIDGSGKDVCTATGGLKNSSDSDRSSWVMASSTSRVYFWQPHCQQLPISRFKSYVVRVTVSGVDDRSPHKTIWVALEGGGNELP
jgi:hypothetical protein